VKIKPWEKEGKPFGQKRERENERKDAPGRGTMENGGEKGQSAKRKRSVSRTSNGRKLKLHRKGKALKRGEQWKRDLKSGSQKITPRRKKVKAAAGKCDRKGCSHSLGSKNKKKRQERPTNPE